MISFSLAELENGWLSNYYPCTIKYDGLEYKSSEAAYQSMKTLDKNDRIRFTQYDADTSKKQGRKLNVRSDWDEVKYLLMVDIVYEKFKQNEELRKMLMSTGDESFLEDTTGWHDNIWGNCSCEKCKNIEGQNLLGKALAVARELIRDETDNKKDIMRNIKIISKDYPDILKIDQTYASINGDDIIINGAVKISSEKPLDLKKAKVYSNLCKENGEILFVLNSFCNMDIQYNTYYSFSMTCSDISRFIDIKDLAFIEIYVVFNKSE